MKRIYLDHAATTPLDARVLKEMEPYFLENYGNASSLHSFGREAREAVEKSREAVAKILNAKPDEIVFNSGGTEGDNTALRGVIKASKTKRIVTSKIEHHAVEHTSKELEKEGAEVEFVEVDSEGFVDVAAIEKALAKETAIASIMHANNEIGTIEPIAEIGEMCREKGTIFHTDAVQSVGKEKIDVEKMNIDLLSASGHKFYGPKGVGFMYIKKGTKILPILHGGGHEKGMRSGTENVAGIVGLAKALEIAENEREKETAREKKLAERLVKGISEIGNSWVNGPEIGSKRLSNNINLGFDFVEGESMVFMMDEKGIACSTGSACSTKDLNPSHVLMAINLKPWKAHGSLRITTGRGTTEKDIDYAVESISEIVKRLREISPLRKGKDISKFEKGFEERHSH